MILSVETKR